MYAYPLDEMAWALARERADEVRQIRPHTKERPRLVDPVRSWLARWLAGGEWGRSQPAAGPRAPAPGKGCC